MIEFGVVVDTTMPNSIISEAFQKCRNSKDLRESPASAATASSPPTPAGRPSTSGVRSSCTPSKTFSKPCQEVQP